MSAQNWSERRIVGTPAQAPVSDMVLVGGLLRGLIGTAIMRAVRDRCLAWSRTESTRTIFVEIYGTGSRLPFLIMLYHDILVL